MWTAHPAKERPGAAIAAVVLIAGLASAAAFAGESAWFGVFAVVVLVGALNRFFFVSRFAIDEKGITANYPMSRQKMKWEEVRRVTMSEWGGHLSMRAEPSRLDATRGMHLLFGTRREEVAAAIRERVSGIAASKA